VINQPNANFLKEIASPSQALIESVLLVPGYLKLTFKSIVAVHGMNMTDNPSHAGNTWTKVETGTNWLRDLLPRRLPNARIMTYQYNANIVFGTSHAGIEEQAENMLVFLSAKRKV
jgi:hypothetical protein